MTVNEFPETAVTSICSPSTKITVVLGVIVPSAVAKVAKKVVGDEVVLIAPFNVVAKVWPTVTVAPKESEFGAVICWRRVLASFDQS